MENKIYQQAILCKEFADKQVESCHKVNVSVGTEQTIVRGDVKGYEAHLNELRSVIKDKYPLIERQIAEAMDKYDSYPYRYQGILESIVKTIISIELQAKISGEKTEDSTNKPTKSDSKDKNSVCNSRKFFISHSSEDKVIVNGFIKEILKIGCGFKDSDIFCTLDPTVIRTGDDFRAKIVENLRACDFVILFISENYMNSEICQNEMGAAWALENKRVLPFVLPNTKFKDMGFLNEVKQGASIADKRKLDEFYNEVCGYYGILSDWPSFNNAKEDFIDMVNSIQ